MHAQRDAIHGRPFAAAAHANNASNFAAAAVVSGAPRVVVAPAGPAVYDAPPPVYVTPPVTVVQPAPPATVVQPAAPMGVPVSARGQGSNLTISITGWTDAPGHTEYFIVTEADNNGMRLRYSSQHRFSAFLDLHDKLRRRQPAMAVQLPVEFPLPKSLFN